MAASTSSSETKTCEETKTEVIAATPEESTVVLKLKKPKTKKKVEWQEGTIDNEHLMRKKSKCCCVYRKPHNFDESSSDSEDEECDHCSGHVERKKTTKEAA